MSEAPALLLVAVSARALAASARRAGFAAIAIDAFGDVDTRAACRETVVVEHAMGGFAGVELESVVAPLSRSHAPAGVIYGSGFDDCPSKLEALARHAPLIGCAPEALARAKDPLLFAESCALAGLAHPELRFAQPPDSGWLLKRGGGSGGLHIAPASAERELAPGEYWQRRIEGRGVSLLFCRDSLALNPIAWSEQWTSPCAAWPFRFGGAAGPLEVEPGDELLAKLAALTGTLGVRGLASADFLDDGVRFWLLEINPRPGATLDLFDVDGDPLLKRHIDAVRGVRASPPKRRAPRATEIVYAEAPCIAPGGEWPDWAADRPAVGTPIAAGAPICTVSARAATVPEAKARTHERARRIAAWLQEGGR